MGGSTKQALLQALSAAEGAYISGQQLAEALGVSRAAVHKAAQALLAQGYALDSAPRRGYRLAGGDPFCAEAVGPYPAPVHIYDTLQSSNLTAKQLALGGAPHGTLVLTAHQQAGRGRLGRRFESPAGKGVYLSLILRPALSAADAQSATISAAVAVARAVKALCGLELGIKWVNDLYYQGRKPAGMAGGGHRPQPDHIPCRLARGAGPHGRQPLPRRARTREPGSAGRGHCPGAALPLPGLRLSGRVPGPLFCAGPLGHCLHRGRDLCRKGPFH